MAAYAGLVSIMHIIEQIQQHYHHHHLDNIQIESLSETVAFLQDFLECYPHDGTEEADALESRIYDAACAAEDVIESHIVDQVSSGDISSSINDLYQGLQKVIQDMEFIKKEVMDIKEKRRSSNQYLNTNAAAVPSGSAPMVGFDDIMYGVMDRLTGGQPDCQVIPICGMGGSGKTTLARNIFVHEIVEQHFDVLAWATISQEYRTHEILVEIISQGNKQHLSKKSEYDQEILLDFIAQENKQGREQYLTEKDDYHQLGEILYKYLYGRRYLIVMDDMWVIDAWEEVNRYFPDNRNGSRILVTTRLSNVALQLNGTNGVEMDFLDEDVSWNLLRRNVFGDENCPPELEEIGRRIAENCNGLPLSIIVIGRVLAKSVPTQQYWEHVADNLSSVVNLDDNEHCLKILSTSYRQLPVHLKPCFLYMGIFEEDRLIRVSSLIKLWIAEGFIRSCSGKTMETVAAEYINDLIDRNLIFVDIWGSNGGIKFCKMHDLLRDLCIRQAHREKFICVATKYNPYILHDTSTKRRIAIHGNISYHYLQPYQSMPLVRSLIYGLCLDLKSLDFRLLRVLNGCSADSYLEKTSFVNPIEALFSQLVNLRHLVFGIRNFWTRDSQLIPSSLCLLWNVHTLICTNSVDFVAPSEIWKMPQLRHVEFGSLILPVPPSGDDVLRNLQTLLKIKNFKCCEEVTKRIPNIKKLQVKYDGTEEWSLSCFDNLGRLKIESLHCEFPAIKGSDFVQDLTFPHSLKKLTLQGCRLQWDDVTTKIGSLGSLQVLKLQYDSTKGQRWETVEERFPKLKYLQIGFSDDDLECWNMDSSTHFPVLEHLLLMGVRKLEKLPSELGYISTLKLIELEACSNSAVLSAKDILDEQEEFENDGIQIEIRHHKFNEQVESFKSRNFKVEFCNSD